jgi:hypothetical protein
MTEINNRGSLEEALALSWQMLTRGATTAKDPFHTPVLGTVKPTGCSLRTVVLRRVIKEKRMLICHSDLRSEKIHEIEKNPRISWLFYHPQQKVQLRLAGQATLHTHDELANQQWAATTLMSRRCYCAPVGPGTFSAQSTSGLPEFLQDRSPTVAESEAGRKNFVVIACLVDFLDWLYLRARGHRRAQFSWLKDALTANWVTP